MSYLNLNGNWQNPEANELEIVERKGIGHPDTLADALAESASIAYSQYCLDRFGAVLHHNLDKLYIGAGLFRQSYGKCQMLKPVRVVTNGRISNSFGSEQIPVAEIMEEAIRHYLLIALPHLKSGEIVVESNATQHTKIPFWYSPRQLSDVPDATTLKANDTSVCVAHWPPTFCEQLAYELESMFWKLVHNVPFPRYPYVGQDIKVMVVRQDDRISVTTCTPLISAAIQSEDEHRQRIQEVKESICQKAIALAQGTSFKLDVQVNPFQPMYALGIGSCIECGEEGMVGRGNGPNGVISAFRPHSVEAPWGKNPVYHTGRVLNYLIDKLAKAIYGETGTPCSIIAMTQTGGSLIPPHFLSISTKFPVDRQAIEKIVDREMVSGNYLREILSKRLVR